MLWTRKALWRLLGLTAVLSVGSFICAIATDAYIDSIASALRNGDGVTSGVLLGHAQAGVEVGKFLLYLSWVTLGAGIVTWVLDWWVKPRANGQSLGHLSHHLEALISGLARAEQSAAVTSAEVEKLRAEKERLRALATLDPAQVDAIARTLAPGGKAGLWVGVAFGVLSLVTWVVSLGLDQNLPWQ